MLWNPQRHEMVNPPVAEYIRRQFPERDLFVYRHRVFGTFTVAEWLNKLTGLCREILVVGTSLADFTRDKMAVLRQILRTPQQEVSDAARRDLRSAVRAWARAADEEQEEFIDIHRYLRRKVRSQVKKDDPLLRSLAGMTEQ